MDDSCQSLPRFCEPHLGQEQAKGIETCLDSFQRLPAHHAGEGTAEFMAGGICGRGCFHHGRQETELR